jgi:peptide/nickel transport system substrate-binding protein
MALNTAPADHETTIIARNLYEGLVEYDATLSLVPCLAVSWETPDPRTWVFRLRPWVRFHDGRTMTAADVVHSILYARESPANHLRTHLQPLTAAEAVDPATVRVTTQYALSELLHLFTSVGIMPAGGPPAGVGTGPYRLASFGKAGATLEAFEGYWGERPRVKRLRFFVMGGEGPEVHASRPGFYIFRDAARFAGPLPPSLEERSTPGMAVNYLGFDVRTPPFDNPRLRRAIRLAVDVPRIIRERLRGNALPACQMVPVNAFGHRPGLACPPDPAAAARELEASGLPRPLDLTVKCTAKGEQTMAFIRQDLAAVGIRLAVEVRPWAELLAAMEERRLDFYFSGYVSSFANGRTTLEMLFASWGGFNTFRYRDAGVDRLLLQARTEFRDAERIRLLQQVQERLFADNPCVPLYNLMENYAVSRGLRWRPRQDGLILGKTME